MLSSCTFHILSSCTIRILHIHLYVLILSYTLCFRILSVLFLCWLKANSFISYLYFSYYVNFYLIFHISRMSTILILLLSYHILSYVFTNAYMYFHILYCHIIYFHLMLSCTFIFCTVISYTFIFILVLSYTFMLYAFILYFSYTVILYYSYTSYTFVRSSSIIYFVLSYTLCTFSCVGL